MDSKKIGAFIALNRKAKGLTQEQLGEKLGVSNKTISRWENGNYMPDLSLLGLLSKELNITLNELLAGEAIETEKTMEYSEKNIINTLDYSTEKIKNAHKKSSVFIMAIGACFCFCAFIISPPDSSWSSFYSIIGLALLIAGVFRELKVSTIRKKTLICACLFLLLLSAFFVLDFIGVSMSKRPPIYRYLTETTWADHKVVLYKNPFYHVYQINADTHNEYFLIDTKKNIRLTLFRSVLLIEKKAESNIF